MILFPRSHWSVGGNSRTLQFPAWATLKLTKRRRKLRFVSNIWVIVESLQNCVLVWLGARVSLDWRRLNRSFHINDSPSLFYTKNSIKWRWKGKNATCEYKWKDWEFRFIYLLTIELCGAVSVYMQQHYYFFTAFVTREKKALLTHFAAGQRQSDEQISQRLVYFENFCL